MRLEHRSKGDACKEFTDAGRHRGIAPPPRAGAAHENLAIAGGQGQGTAERIDAGSGGGRQTRRTPGECPRGMFRWVIFYVRQGR